MIRRSVLIRLTRVLGLVLFALGSGAVAQGERISDEAWWVGHWAPEERNPSARRSAQYVEARDGTRIATYLYLPDPLREGDRVPTILVMTPYTSETDLTWFGELVTNFGGGEPSFAERLARYGFATLLMDARGAGASFGTKRSILMPDLLRDGSVVLDWIVEQPWSNGKVGATGCSAVGMTANWLATTSHPALKAIAPRCTIFDIFNDVHAGGALPNRFLADIDRHVRLLDANLGWKIPGNWFLRALAWTQANGFMRMDEDRDGSLLKAAVAEHAKNEYFASDIAAVTYRDDLLPGSSIPATLDTQSPFTHVEAMRASGIPIYAIAGWLDASFGRAQIANHKTVRNPGSKLVIGPWAHGFKFYSSPRVEGDRRSDFDLVGELVRFFDHHLRGVDTGIADEPPIHYFTMGEERWRSAREWPPPHKMERWYFGVDHRLSPHREDLGGSDRYQVDLTATTGVHSRFGKHLTGGASRAEYPNRREEDEKLLTYTLARADARNPK